MLTNDYGGLYKGRKKKRRPKRRERSDQVY